VTLPRLSIQWGPSAVKMKPPLPIGDELSRFTLKVSKFQNRNVTEILEEWLEKEISVAINGVESVRTRAEVEVALEKFISIEVASVWRNDKQFEQASKAKKRPNFRFLWNFQS
jgi:hypothetical protein